MEKFKITFLPDNKTVEADRDKTILAAALSGGVCINSACGGDGVCGRCKVRIRSGTVSSQPSPALTLEEKRQNVYLACLTTAHSDTQIEVLPASRLDFERLSPEETAFRLKGMYSGAEDVAALAREKACDGFAYEPLTQKMYVELPKPDLNDRISDLERLFRGISPAKGNVRLETSLAVIRTLSELLRDADWKVTVTLGRRRGGGIDVTLIEPGDTSGGNLGLAFDIGTTTISGQLIDFSHNTIAAAAASYNKQSPFGSDVITRILHARTADGLEQLHDAVVDTVNDIIRALASGHKADLNDITSVVCAGNTTMMHLLLSIDPAYIRREPYTPTANFFPVMRASEADIRINPRALLQCVPGVASYVGGDTTAGVLACGLHAADELTLLIDIGTNGEIVLGNKEFMAACAASAGPAFEGSGISCGMRASRGAIQKITLAPETFCAACETIGAQPARGICGSGYIGLLAQMLARGIMDKNGKIGIDNHPRVRTGETGREFVVCFKGEHQAVSDIVITEPDIENLKRAKAAIYSAAAVLVEYMGLDMRDVRRIYIAGGFGMYLDVESAAAIGLLPDLDRSVFKFIGNSALTGARQILLSSDAARAADEIAARITYCELSVMPAYMDEYTAAAFFPHTDLSRFPGLRGSRLEAQG